MRAFVIQSEGAFGVVRGGDVVLRFESASVAQNVAEALNGNRRVLSVYDWDECDEVAEAIEAQESELQQSLR